MTEGVDYIIVHEANTVNYEKLMEMTKCVFIGTRDYFFVVPFNLSNFTMSATSNTIDETDMFYEGMPIQEFLAGKVKEKSLSVKDFEQFMIDANFDGGAVLNIEKEVNRFKVKADFWGSALTYNQREGRVGWKMLIGKYKKEKHKVMDFYKDHPKRKK